LRAMVVTDPRMHSVASFTLPVVFGVCAMHCVP